MNKYRLTAKLIIFLSITTLLLTGCSQKAQVFNYSEYGDHGNLVLYVFWGDGCSHCENAKTLLAQLNEKYSDLNIRGFEIWKSSRNLALYNQMADHYQLPINERVVPVFYLGDHIWTGYSDEIAADITVTVKSLSGKGVIDVGAGIMPGAFAATANPESAKQNLAPANPFSQNPGNLKVNICSADQDISDCNGAGQTTTPAGQ
jgi:thiol-disulfide isomerase/thioredoxin